MIKSYMPYYLYAARVKERRAGFMPFLIAFAQSEKKTALSRTRTCTADTIASVFASWFLLHQQKTIQP